MPTGCNEQTFNSWIPNVVAVRYLEAVGELTQTQRADLEIYLKAGVQHVSKLKNSDGSYNLFYGTPKSIWLTAYIAKLLAYSKGYISLDDKLIFSALSYLRSQQQTDGSFVGQGLNTHYNYLTKSDSGVALTAFVAIAFLNNKDHDKDFASVTEKALNYINSKVELLSDNYEFAISAYALSLGKRESSSDSFIRELKRNAIEEVGTRGKLMYWYRESRSLSSQDSKSVNVEIAAYALMAFVSRKEMESAFSIMNWLITQRSGTGGFFSTIDTVIGTEALTIMATQLFHPNVNINVKLTNERARENTVKINNKNAMELQPVPLEQTTRRINCNVNGNGLAYVQVAYQFNTIVSDPKRRFDLIISVLSKSTKLLHLKICAKYIPEGEKSTADMTLMEVFLPSGYVYDDETAQLVKKVGVQVR